MRYAKPLMAAACCLALASAIAGCSNSVTATDIPTQESTPNESQSEDASVDINIDGMDFDYTDRDRDASYDESTATRLTLDGNAATVKGDGAIADGATATITKEGTYIVSGTLDDGQLIVDATSSDKIQIVFDNATVHNEDGPAVYVKQADKVFITLAGGSTNSLSDGSEYALDEGSDEPSATLFSKDDLTINGSGSLTVSGNYQHAICSKDDLVITGGTYDITAVEDALRGKDCVKVADGLFTISAGQDGLKSTNDEDGTRGFITIDSGAFDISAGDDALHAESVLQVNTGTIDIATCTEGLEAERIFVNDGTVNLVSTDDGINASARATVSGTLTEDERTNGAQDAPAGMAEGQSNMEDMGPMSEDPNAAGRAESGDAAIVDPNVGGQTPPDMQNDGEMRERGGANANPGARGQAQGDMQLPRDMQTPNGNMGLMAGANESCLIQINGGTVVIDAQGDGLDSNGYLEINGGTVLVNGPSANAESTMDYEYGSALTGGTVLLVGSAGMGETFGSGSTQAFLSERMQGQAGDTVRITNASGEILSEITAARPFQTIIASSQSMIAGSAYSITINSAEITATAR